MKKLFKLFPLVGILFVANLFVGCSDDDDDNRSTASSILEMTFEEEVVVQQPVINGTDILFYVSPEAEEADLKELTPVIKVSEKATVTPASGAKVDFSKGMVEFTVTAENPDNKTVYKVSWQRLGKYDFEKWEIGNPKALEKNQYSQPVGDWNSSNGGVASLLGLGSLLGISIDRYIITQTDDAYAGESAARIETLDTQGREGSGFIPNIPKITTGSLFLGKFITDMKNTLNSTKFGIPYAKKPLKVKGYYKYTPGDDFYRATGMDDCHLAKKEDGTVDQCAINAILYEYEKDLPENPTKAEEDEYYAQFLTGVNAYTSDKIVAIAQLADGSAKDSYTAFELTLDYKKTYDPAKKYLFAIICSSSKWGDTFSGAPNSVLYIDEIEVISE